MNNTNQITDDVIELKKTLNNAIDTLRDRVNNLNELKILSDEMINKFERWDGDINKKKDIIEEELQTQPNIIDLINGLSQDMEIHMYDIKNNIDKMINWIE